MNQPANKIIIADTQFLIVSALMVLLDGQAECAAEAVSSSAELYKVLEKESCHLLITDHLLFDYKHPEGLQEIKRRYPKLSVLILTNSLTKPEFTELSKIGIKNILNKTADREELLSAIDAGLKGKKYYSEEILDMILEMSESKAVPEEPMHLTHAEVEIVKLIAGGLTTKEIAHQKNVSFHTVNTHRKNIFRKLNVSNASELIMHAIRAGWIDNIEYFI